LAYNDRLVKLNIDSLELRRLRLDLVYVYKIMFGLVDTDISNYFTLQSANNYSAVTCRGNPYKLLINHCRINVRKKLFSERVIKVWNSLPPSIVNFESLSSFRNSLNNVNLRIYIRRIKRFYCVVYLVLFSRPSYFHVIFFSFVFYDSISVRHPVTN